MLAYPVLPKERSLHKRFFFFNQFESVILLTGRCLEEREGILTKEKEKERFVDFTHNS